LFGDVLSTFTYQDYSVAGNLSYPRTIQIEKINGKVKDEVKILTSNTTNEAPQLLEKPIDYSLKEDEETVSEIKVEKFSDNIHFIELKHTDDKIMIVEFSDFLLVAEAPLNSKNGELIISEAKKIAPNKPIKYFVFGHYHPHYLGGMRPFIHKGAKIICSKQNEEYVKYLANAPHTLNPDSLQIQAKPLLIEEIKDSLTITDGKFPMKIYFIGKKSEHTNDYLIYYFPTEKLLFEDDLVWIPKKGEIRKASGRQAGLYNAIKELGLEVQTIIQSWPVADYGVKTIIPFKDLKESMTKE
jgi:glyoxylase-like metal-dependent hydrolase (beta-lactamase superfamily II)